MAKSNYYEDLGQFFRRVDLLISIEDKKFIGSQPVKVTNEPSQLFYEKNTPSHNFTFIGNYQKNKILDKVAKMIINNMKSDEKKSVT